jgi:Protein of unknown function (DUF3761)
MKILAKIILSVILFAPLAVHADAPPPSPSESQLVEHGSYINKDGVRVHSPAHTKCVIHAMSVHDFTACRSSISGDAGHGFHGMSVQRFMACRSSS